MFGEDYKHARYCRFEKTGCLSTTDSSEDSKINPEDLDNYVVPPFLPIAYAEQPQTCPFLEASPNKK